MAKGYWIVHIDIRDPEIYPKYIAADAAAFRKFNAKFLVGGGRFDAVEGASRRRNVVIEFASLDEAVKCYHSAEYREAAKLRRAYADSDVLIVEGT